MDAIPPPPPMEYDSSTNTVRPISWYSSPANLAWVLVIALAVIGFADHTMWIVGGVVAATILLVEWGLRRRRAAQPATAPPPGDPRR